ncbi:Protein kinase domain - like 10 [Theobroma cacao]|nr:Protein kinase domain - like 10 [Theobroma cacao]
MATRFSNSVNFLCLFSFLSLLPYADSVSFKISRFDPTLSSIIYQGDAKLAVGTVEFNLVNYINRVGWATYADSVLLWDSETGRLSDFTTHFSFEINVQNDPIYGHGLCFFLSPVGSQIPPNSAGGFLGLYNTTTSDSPSNQIVSVEFDSFENPEWDPYGIDGHVGINNNSIASAVYTPWNASFHSKDTANVFITYNSTTKNLSVSWSYFTTTNPRENSNISLQIDLRRVLPERVMIGFSAATGKYVERHILKSWEFHSSLEEVGTDGRTARRINILVASAVPVSVLIAGTVIAFIIWWRWQQGKRKTAETTNLASINNELERGAGPWRFSFKDLVSATNNFSEGRKLGEGGFGAVYRGYLIDLDIAIAVKKISRGSKQGKKEYATEVKVISQLRHRNLVQLIGWCHERRELLLVYEFMPNGSLDYHLFGQRIPLTWPVRYRISLGLASAIFYLHEEWEQCVVHRDIKSSNVMLDSSFNVKLGDFGLARLVSHELGPKTTGLAGTLGYLAPEYISTGRASKVSDVFSFGVVLLEIATGRKSADLREATETGLVEWVWDLYGEGKLLLAVDGKLKQDFDEKQVECSMITGLWCAHPDSRSRPSIRQAIQVLNLETAIPTLPTKMPVPTFHVPPISFISKGLVLNYSSSEAGYY